MRKNRQCIHVHKEYVRIMDEHDNQTLYKLISLVIFSSFHTISSTYNPVQTGIRKMRTTKLAHERADEDLETKRTLSISSYPHLPSPSPVIPTLTRTSHLIRTLVRIFRDPSSNKVGTKLN